VLQIPWGNPSAGAVAPRGASGRAAARAARRLSARARRERWPERRRRQGAEGPVEPGGASVGAPTTGIAGIGPGPVDRHGWSSTRLVMRIR
jgi:hypothetical protein